MSNLFSMVTLRSSLDYTYYAIESFFKNTQLNEDDEFLLIDNDGCELKNFYNNKKIKIIKNKSFEFCRKMLKTNQLILLSKKKKI